MLTSTACQLSMHYKALYVKAALTCQLVRSALSCSAIVCTQSSQGVPLAAASYINLFAFNLFTHRNEQTVRARAIDSFGQSDGWAFDLYGSQAATSKQLGSFWQAAFGFQCLYPIAKKQKVTDCGQAAVTGYDLTVTDYDVKGTCKLRLGWPLPVTPCVALTGNDLDVLH